MSCEILCGSPSSVVSLKLTVLADNWQRLAERGSFDLHCGRYARAPLTAPPLPELVSYLEDLAEPHILFDRRYRIVSANAAYRKQFSPERSVVGRTCYEVSHEFSVPCDRRKHHCKCAVWQCPLRS